MRKLTMFVMSVLFALSINLAAQDPLRPLADRTQVRVRLKSGEELTGRIIRKEAEGIVFAAEAGNQVNIRDLANADIDTITPTVALQRLNSVSEFARRLPPGAGVQLRLVNGEKLQGRLLRTSAQDLELDLSRNGKIEMRLVAYSEIRQVQMKAPRSAPRILASAPMLIYLGLRLAGAF